MGCCIVAALLIGAPRIGLFLWWIANPARFALTFQSWMGMPQWVLPVLGFLFLPWTTLAFVFVAPGGISVLDWVILGIALLIDLAAHTGGGRAYRQRQDYY